MDKITEQIKNKLRSKYPSIKCFSEVSGIPYTTITSALTKGVGGTSYDTVVKMCNLLNIRQSEDYESFIDEDIEILNKLKCLDELGLHTVKAVLNVEYERCTTQNTKLSYKQSD